MPYGFAGTLQGAGSCIFAFAGFKAVFYERERVAGNPRKNIPLASLTTLFVSAALYVGE